MKIFYFVCILSAQAQNGTASADVDERRRERPGGEKVADVETISLSLDYSDVVADPDTPGEGGKTFHGGSYQQSIAAANGNGNSGAYGKDAAESTYGNNGNSANYEQSSNYGTQDSSSSNYAGGDSGNYGVSAADSGYQAPAATNYNKQPNKKPKKPQNSYNDNNNNSGNTGNSQNSQYGSTGNSGNYAGAGSDQYGTGNTGNYDGAATDQYIADQYAAGNGNNGNYNGGNNDGGNTGNYDGENTGNYDGGNTGNNIAGADQYNAGTGNNNGANSDQYNAGTGYDKNAQNQGKDQYSGGYNGDNTGYGGDISGAYDTGANYGDAGYGNAGYGDGYSTGLTCWKCNAKSFDDCEAYGYVETCQSNQESCELEIRERSHYKSQARIIEQINMGCKQKMACENNHSQNFQGDNPAYTQCRPEMDYTHSVCRQCCSENNCVKEPSWWYPVSRDEWAYTENAVVPGY